MRPNGKSTDSESRPPLALRILVIGYFLAGFGVTFYFAFTDTGLVAWLNAVQAKLMYGSFYPVLSFILCLFVLLSPALVFIFWVARKQTEGDTAGEPGAE